MIEAVKDDVRTLLQSNHDGHGFDHIERVYHLAVRLAEKENADVLTVSLAALLHDVDDYKLFGDENADKLFNARQILARHTVAADVAGKVCTIIQNMGYSKALKGVRPQTLEGKVVSDADMLDAIGANGLVRCLAFALQRCAQYGAPIFDRKVFPELALTAEEYKKPNRKSDNFINHFFEKMLRLQGLMITSAGREEAVRRHEFMIVFLRQYFEENNAAEWLAYLDDYLSCL